MPTAAQYKWIESNRDYCIGPYADIGSRIPTSRGKNSKEKNWSLRELFPDAKWTGIDMQAGRGVDVVHDLTAGPLITEIFDVPALSRYATVFLLSVLEHVDKPWKLAENIEHMLFPGGVLFVSVPWCWRYHAHPHDYWRMSPDAVKSLFPSLEFIERASCIHYGVNQKPLKGFDIRLTRPYAHRDKHLMHPVTVNMVFRKCV